MTLETQIENKIKNAFSVVYMDVSIGNIEYQWLNGHKPELTIELVSDDFEGQRVNRRHRAVYSLLTKHFSDEFDTIKLYTYSEKEWLELYGHHMPSYESQFLPVDLHKVHFLAS